MNTKNIQSGIEYFLSWQWVKKFLYWLVVSAGTVSECVFLIASLWISINSTVHALVLKMVSEATSETLSQLSVASFTSLPEIIVGLAFVTTYGHIKNFCLHRKRSSLTWGILFGTPTLVFMGLSLWTLGASSLHIGYEMPPFVVATRALAGYLYGFLSMLFVLIGEPDYADLVSTKDSMIAELKAKINFLQEDSASRIADLKSHFETEIDQTEKVISDLKSQNLDLINQLSNQQNKILKLSERASSLERGPIELYYPAVYSEWINAGKKTVSVEEIVRITGLSKRKIQNANIQKSPRNDKLYLVTSVIDWLKTLPFSSNSNGHDRDTEALNLPVLTLITEE